MAKAILTDYLAIAELNRRQGNAYLCRSVNCDKAFVKLCRTHFSLYFGCLIMVAKLKVLYIRGNTTLPIVWYSVQLLPKTSSQSSPASVAWSIAWAGIGNPKCHNSNSDHDGYLVMFNFFLIHTISLSPGGVKDIKARTLVCLHSYPKPRLICILLWDTELKEGRKRREREMGIVANLVLLLVLAKKGSVISSSRHATIRLLALEDCCFIRASLSSLWWDPIWILIRVLSPSCQDKNPNMYYAINTL